jgi:high-affinity iron transporter
MLLNSVIFVLREVLEASLIISALLALSHNRSLSKNWLVPAILVGLMLAGLYASQLAVISAYYDGVGQEIVNAVLHLLIYFFILLTIGLLKYSATKHLIVYAMACCVIFASIREASEIITYISGFIALPELFSSVAIGSIIGASIGISVGILFYYLIAYASLDKGLFFGLVLLVLFAGGMVSQSIQLLTQADLITSQAPLWDSSFLVDERSIVGQLLYALISYESTPTPVQFICYSGSIVLAAVLIGSSLLSSNLFKKTP